MVSMATRDFTAKFTANNSKYIAAKHAHLINQDFFRLLTHLQSLPNGDHALAERLDTNLREASQAAANKVKHFHKPWWSKENIIKVAFHLPRFPPLGLPRFPILSSCTLCLIRNKLQNGKRWICLTKLCTTSSPVSYTTSPSPRDRTRTRMPSSA